MARRPFSLQTKNMGKISAEDLYKTSHSKGQNSFTSAKWASKDYKPDSRNDQVRLYLTT